MRYEWVLGTPQLAFCTDYKTKGYMYGIQNMQMVSDEYYSFKSEVTDVMSLGLLGNLAMTKNRDNSVCAALINIVTQWCIADAGIARYIFDCPTPSLRFAHYSDIFIVYA